MCYDANPKWYYWQVKAGGNDLMPLQFRSVCSRCSLTSGPQDAVRSSAAQRDRGAFTPPCSCSSSPALFKRVGDFSLVLVLFQSPAFHSSSCFLLWVRGTFNDLVLLCRSVWLFYFFLLMWAGQSPCKEFYFWPMEGLFQTFLLCTF